MRRNVLNFITITILLSIIVIGCDTRLRLNKLSGMYLQTIPKVVSIYTEEINLFTGEQEIRCKGSGFLVDYQKGLVFTANHVTFGSDSFQVEFDSGVRIVAAMYGLDAANDISILKIDPDLIKEIKFSKLKFNLKPVVGEWVFSIGNPAGFKNLISLGILSRSLILDNRLTWAAFPSGFYLSDIHIFGGHSGSPVFDSENRVIGMIVGYWQNYAIIVPASSIVKVLKNANNWNKIKSNSL